MKHGDSWVTDWVCISASELWIIVNWGSTINNDCSRRNSDEYSTEINLQKNAHKIAEKLKTRHQLSIYWSSENAFYLLKRELKGESLTSQYQQHLKEAAVKEKTTIDDESQLVIANQWICNQMLTVPTLLLRQNMVYLILKVLSALLCKESRWT